MRQSISGFSLSGLTGDGLNLYQYARSNPVLYSDPMGLSSYDPFQDVDDFVAQRAGSAAAVLDEIGQGARAAAVAGATIMSVMPTPPRTAPPASPPDTGRSTPRPAAPRPR